MDNELNCLPEEDRTCAQKITKKYDKLYKILEKMIDLSKLDLDSPDTTLRINYKIVGILEKYPGIYQEKDNTLKQKYIVANALRASLFEGYRKKQEKSSLTSG